MKPLEPLKGKAVFHDFAAPPKCMNQKGKGKKSLKAFVSVWIVYYAFKLLHSHKAISTNVFAETWAVWSIWFSPSSSQTGSVFLVLFSGSCKDSNNYWSFSLSISLLITYHDHLIICSIKCLKKSLKYCRHFLKSKAMSSNRLLCLIWKSISQRFCITSHKTNKATHSHNWKAGINSCLAWT